MLGVSFPYSSWIASGLSFKKKVAPGHFKETDAQNKKKTSYGMMKTVAECVFLAIHFGVQM